MHLRRLTVRGFKSFADKTDFDFESALTGVVGPNGCGKSNVVDALKWVLGDQRARSLRGKEMTDVIFKGAEGRDGAHEAEVVVVLSDVDRASGNGRGEVTIGRRLTVEKESEYLLNGEPVRLKDVRDFLMDTGLGVGAYSVMEQGRIDAVLSANPEDRRAIFEEAAGISRFKVQKRESLRRLDRTEQNLARVKDLLEDRARRIRSLKVQAGRARRYQVLRDELRDLRTACAVIEGREFRRQQAECAQRLSGLKARLTATDTEQQAIVDRRQQAEAEIDRRTVELERLQEQLRALTSQQESLAHEAQTQEQRAGELLADAEEGARRRQQLEEQHQEKLQALEVARARIVQLEEQLVALAKDLEEHRAKVRRSQGEVRSLHEQREQARQRVLEWIHRRTRVRNLAHDQEAQIQSHDTRIRALDQRHQKLDAEAEQIDGEVCRLEAGLTEREQQEADLAAEKQLLQQELHAAGGEVADLDQRESALRQELSATEGRLSVLCDMEAHLEGLDQGPRVVLDLQPEGLKGRLLDRIEVDLRYSAAVEAALGPYVQALVVATRRHAERILETLSAEGKGRVLLLVAEEMATDELREGPALESEPSPAPTSAPPSMSAPTSAPPSAPTPPRLPPGAVPLVEHVRCPLSDRRLVAWLLRDVYLVPGLADTTPDLCFVTPEGALRWGPRLEGGSVEGTGGLVVRRAQIAALKQDVEGLRVRLHDLLEQKQTWTRRVGDLENESSDLDVTLQQLRGDIQADMARRDRLLDRVQDFERELGTLRQERRDVQRQRWTAQAALMTQLLNEFLLGRLESKEVAEEAAIARELMAAQARAQERGHAEQEVQLLEVQYRSERQATRDAIRMHGESVAELKQTTAGLREREAQNRDAAREARLQAEGCLARKQDLGRQHQELTTQREQVQKSLVTARDELGEVQRAAAELQARHGELSEEITNERLAASDLEHAFARLEERVREEVSVCLRRCLGEVSGFGIVTRVPFGPPPPADLAVRELQGPPLPPDLLAAEMGLARLWEQEGFDVAAARSQAEVARARLDRLGAVNLGAVQELDEEEDRFQRMEQEIRDLNESRRALIEALRRMESESRALFEETFEAARKNFQEIFRKLFQGGRADMYLEVPKVLADLDATEGGEGAEGAQGSESPVPATGVGSARARGEAPLDSLESGIEIVARPPGKELQSINLLSGGERSLTALAILFAVFKVKPSPFCVLDEVDAALDETNVERFLRVLREFVGPTQFCIVTHHKRTMAECQTLYGITMQRRGVSSRIAVSLDQVDELHEDGPRGRGNRPEPTRQRVAGEERVGF